MLLCKVRKPPTRCGSECGECEGERESFVEVLGRARQGGRGVSRLHNLGFS